MGKSCCIKGCNVTNPDVEYFKFPRGGSLLAAWVKATGAASGDVCSAHFTLTDYRSIRGKRRLMGTAIPSVFHNTDKIPSTTENGDITSLDKAIDVINKKANAKSKKKKVKNSIDKSKSETKDDSSIDKTKEIKDNNVSTTDKNETTEEKIEKGESLQDGTREAESNQDKGKDEKKAKDAQPEINDIEDMITNYQIKQTKTLADRLNPEPLEDLIPAAVEALPQRIEPPPVIQETSISPSKLDVNQLASQLADKLDNQLAQIMSAAPVFIEVAVEQGATRAESPQDCLMLLESVQCDVDPSSLMLPEHGPDTDSDMEIVDCDAKVEDPNPISLLTSSDEDEVIIEEPHIDTVEVSDETDEDDRPLQRLVADKPKPKLPRPPKPAKPKKKGNYEYCVPFYCVQCDFKTDDETEYRQHNLELAHVHGTTIQVCPTCNYATASKAQYSRHKRKHRDERNFKCHLCNYKARHNMSLIYHLKSHDPVEKKQEKFTCDKCGFSSNVKSEALNHLKGKGCDGNRYSCDQCSYSTKRRSDLRRHRMRRHSVDDSDEEFAM